MIRVDKDQIKRTEAKKGEIIFSNFNGYWKEELSVPALKDINCHFGPNKIYGITGKVGSGKSGFLAAIIGEIPYFSGQLQIDGSIALFQQEPFIFSDTVRNNIVFGKKYDKKLYEKSVKMACLTTDFRLLAQGDQTIVG